MVDWVAHYDAIYATLGVDATIDVGFTAGPATIRAVEKSVGTDAGGQRGLGAIANIRGGVEVMTMLPAACVRRAELTEKGIALADLDDAPFVMNGKAFEIKAHHPRPAPTGEAAGEELLILIEA